MYCCKHQMTLSAAMWFARTYSEGLMSSFYRFLARFSGRRRGGHLRVGTMHMIPIVSLLALQFLSPFVEGCSSRSTPKPRPPAVPSTSRPNVTFHTYPCSAEHAAYYCLNGGTCFAVRVVRNNDIPYCECADGYVGERCEFKNLEGTYVAHRKRVILETASIASGATLAVFLVVVVCMFLYVRVKRNSKQNPTVPVESREDLERRGVPPHREGHLFPAHHVLVERNTGDVISLAVYTNLGVTTEPP